MVNQGSDSLHGSIQVPGQAQMRREELLNQPSDIHNQRQGQATNLLQESGTQVKNRAQGAAGSAVNMARGAATGAAEAVKNTLGMKPRHNTTDASSGNCFNQPGTINFDDDFPNTNYPINPHNPNTGI